jgi:hypothetical protein
MYQSPIQCYPVSLTWAWCALSLAPVADAEGVFRTCLLGWLSVGRCRWDVLVTRPVHYKMHSNDHLPLSQSRQGRSHSRAQGSRCTCKYHMQVCCTVSYDLDVSVAHDAYVCTCSCSHTYTKQHTCCQLTGECQTQAVQFRWFVPLRCFINALITPSGCVRVYALMIFPAYHKMQHWRRRCSLLLSAQ